MMTLLRIDPAVRTSPWFRLWRIRSGDLGNDTDNRVALSLGSWKTGRPGKRCLRSLPPAAGYVFPKPVPSIPGEQDGFGRRLPQGRA